MTDDWPHLAFIFSSPLVRKQGNDYLKVMKIDYRTEISELEWDLKKTNFEMRYITSVGTEENFRKIFL